MSFISGRLKKTEINVFDPTSSILFFHINKLIIMTQSIINYAEHNIPADVGTLGQAKGCLLANLSVVWNNETQEFFFTNTWGYDTSFLNDLWNRRGYVGKWEYDYAAKNLQEDVNLFAVKQNFNLINKVKYLVTYNDEMYIKEYLLKLVKEMKGLL